MKLEQVEKEKLEKAIKNGVKPGNELINVSNETKKTNLYKRYLAKYETKNITSQPLKKKSGIAKFVLRKHSKSSKLEIDEKDIPYAKKLIENKRTFTINTNATGTFLVVNPSGNLAIGRKGKEEGNVPTTTSNTIKKAAEKAAEEAKAKKNAEEAAAAESKRLAQPFFRN